MKEEYDAMSGDIPNAFIQAFVPDDGKDGDECIIMKITGRLIDALLEIAPEVYGPYVVYEDGKRVLYVQVLSTLYRMLVAALLCYKMFRSNLESIRFKFNNYVTCVAN